MKQSFKTPIFKLLGFVMAGLALVLGLMWLKPVRSALGFSAMQWQPPAALHPDFSLPETALTQPLRPDREQQFAGILARPLFSPNRQPPPVIPVEVAAEAEAPPPDPFANIQLKGVYASAKGGGIIVQIDGVVKRVQVDESIGADWLVKSIKGRDVTLTRQNEERVLNLPHFVPGVDSRTSVKATQAATGRLPSANSPPPLAIPGIPLSEEEKIQAQRRRRAQLGLPIF